MSARFFICDHCGNLITMLRDAGVPMLCCGEKMWELIPNTVEASGEKHLSEAARRQPTAVQKGKADFLSAADLLWLFVIGAFLGDVVETVFCRLTAGVWMSRSSLVWGPFSVVWGLALAMATVLLRQNQEKSDRYLFAFGTVLGGVYEYVCSAVTELLFGTVFWDYSKFKFNLGGRINLLYCFFWGIAAAMRPTVSWKCSLTSISTTPAWSIFTPPPKK